MLFNGKNMSGGNNSYSHTTNTINYNLMTVGYGIYDTLHILDGLYYYTHSYVYDTLSDTSIYDQWLSETLLLSTFSNSLSGGSIDLNIKYISAIRIKRKLANQYNSKYITLFEKTVSSVDDLITTEYDNYAKAKNTYTYAVCPVMKDGTEGELSETTVYSDFCGVALCDREHLYFTELETNYSFAKNHSESIVKTLYNKYPYVIHNDIIDYWTGSMSAMWVGINDYEYDLENAFIYRSRFCDWLNNGEAKILKLDDGREWLISINDNIQESSEDHWQKVITSFDWTEIGDCENAKDLYNTGLIEKDPDNYAVE